MSSCHTPDVISIKAVGSNTPWNQKLLKSKGEGSLSWLMDNNQVKIKEFWNSHLLQRAQWTILCNHGNLTFRAEKKTLKEFLLNVFLNLAAGVPGDVALLVEHVCRFLHIPTTPSAHLKLDSYVK